MYLFCWNRNQDQMPLQEIKFEAVTTEVRLSTIWWVHTKKLHLVLYLIVLSISTIPFCYNTHVSTIRLLCETYQGTKSPPISLPWQGFWCRMSWKFWNPIYICSYFYHFLSYARKVDFANFGMHVYLPNHSILTSYSSKVLWGFDVHIIQCQLLYLMSG